MSRARCVGRDPARRALPRVGRQAADTRSRQVHRIGADDFMKKPFSRPEVFTRIERLLDDDGIPRRVGMPAQTA